VVREEQLEVTNVGGCALEENKCAVSAGLPACEKSVRVQAKN
jgi:hypothetical protein